VRRQFVASFMKAFTRFEHRLAGNASDAQACAAELFVFIDDRHVEAKLCRARRSNISAGSGADDDKIVLHKSWCV